MAFPHDENEVGILYDDEQPIDVGYGYTLYRAISSCQLDEIHRDIISYWDEGYESLFNIGVVIDTKEPKDICLQLIRKDNVKCAGLSGVDLDSDGWTLF